MKTISRTVKKIAQNLGYEINRIDRASNPNDAVPRLDLCVEASEIVKRHWRQTKETVSFLKQKYTKAVFGKVNILDMLKLLSECIDPTDVYLGGASQLTYVLSVADEMERDGVKNPDLLIAALVHDLGKVLLLTDEKPENIVCLNRPIDEYEEGVGLENCVFQWDHDEFAYVRLKDYLPKHISWLIRYHSIIILESEPYMNECDREYCQKYLIPFQKYDQDFKSVYRVPKKQPGDYQALINTYFPKEIIF